MSKFLRKMNAMSVPKPAPVSIQTGTVPVSTSVPFINTVPVSTSVPSSATVPETGSVPHSRVRVFRATRVEQGHSSGEHIIYEVLWRNADGDMNSRTIRIGYDRLASLAAVNWKTARTCLKSLEEKLAIETIGREDSNSRLGKTYRIYSFTWILERRRESGLEWVEKGRGVRFIPKPGTVPVSTTVPDPRTVPPSATVVEAGTETVPVSGTETVPVSGTPLGTQKEVKEETSSSPVSIVCRRNGLALDDAAARKIILRCRQLDPTATEDEIAYVTAAKLEQLRNKRNVGNLVGLLISSVPVYFEDPQTEIHHYRAKKLQERTEMEKMAQQILEDPNRDDQDKRWASEVIETARAGK
jgi:hypothetical protein